VSAKISASRCGYRDCALRIAAITLDAISSGRIRDTCSVIDTSVGIPLCPTVTRTAPPATDSVMLTCSTCSAICWNRAAF
jgi:hypothetical protein